MTVAAASATLTDLVAPARPTGLRFVLLVTFATLATTAYDFTWTVVAVALPHMQGTFSTTSDQIAWVLIAFMVGSAVMTASTGWFFSPLRAQESVFVRHRRLHDLACRLRHGDIADRDIHMAFCPGPGRRVADPAGSSHRGRRLSARTSWSSDIDLGSWCDAGKRRRTDRRRVSAGVLQLALGLLHAPSPLG